MQTRGKSKAKMVNTAFACQFTWGCKFEGKCGIYHLCLLFNLSLHFFAPNLHGVNFSCCVYVLLERKLSYVLFLYVCFVFYFNFVVFVFDLFLIQCYHWLVSSPSSISTNGFSLLESWKIVKRTSLLNNGTYTHSK